MDKILMLTDYYVYKLLNKKTGEFYIGSHACKGTSSSCSKTKCNYKGSSGVIRKSKNPEDWVKLIVEYAEHRPELAIKEKAFITKYIGDPKCLNKIIASPSKRPTYTAESLESLKSATRRKVIKMISPSDQAVHQVAREEIPLRVKEGWNFHNPVVWIKNNEAEVYGQFSAKTVCGCWVYLEKGGWEFGYDRSFRAINTEELLASIKVKKVRKTIITYEPC